MTKVTTTNNITYCYSTGAISGENNGGIGGYNCLYNIRYCYSTGVISGTNAGGITGYSFSDGAGVYNTIIIEYCYSTGAISGEGAGGICGGLCKGIVRYCYSSGAISGTNSGGICGIYNYTNYVTYCYSSGVISGTGSGIISTNSSITTSTGSMSGNGTWSDTNALITIAQSTSEYWVYIINNNTRWLLTSLKEISGLTTSQISALTSSYTAKLTTYDIVRVTATQLSALTTDGISGIPTDSIATLTTTNLVILTTTQVSGLSSTQIQALTTIEVAALTTAQFSSLTTAKLTSLTTKQIYAITTSDVTSITTLQLGSFTDTQLSAISYSVISTLTSTQLASLAGRYIFTLGAIACFNEDTKILCFDDVSGEHYKPIQDLRKGSLVKTYQHGYRKIDLIGKKMFINDPAKWYKCMYVCKTPEHFEEELIITGTHSILVDELSEAEKMIQKRVAREEPRMIDDKYLLLTALSKSFEKVTDKKIFTYYHFTVEHDDPTAQYGIWANGILVETTYTNDFLNNDYVLL